MFEDTLTKIKLLKFFRSKNVHYHGIIHAFGMTILVLLQQEFLRNNWIDENALLFSVIHTGIPALYLAFATWHYCIASEKNTILSNFHAGVVISFIHPFIYAFCTNLYRYQEISILGVSVKYMVSLMVISLPVAAAVYLFFEKIYPAAVEKGRVDILDDEF